MLSGDPAECVDLPGIGKTAKRVHRHFPQKVRQCIFVVIDVRLDHDAIGATDVFHVLFVKRKLNVGDAGNWC